MSKFMLQDTESIKRLYDELHNGTYVEREHKTFMIHEPKEREIMSLKFRDRIFQRSLNDNAVYPQMTKSVIYDNCACQKGKGNGFAIKRLKIHLERAYREWGPDFYVLQTDICKYYPMMYHPSVLEKFKRNLEPEVWKMVKEILAKFTGDIGYSAGSQLIQIAGISLLDDTDHFAKEQLHIKHYIRYMDDIVILAKDKETAERWLAALREEVVKVHCTFHEERRMIYPISKGIKFLGFTFSITSSGKILMFPKSKNISKEKRKLKKMVNKSPQISREKINECFTAWKSYLTYGNTHNVLTMMNNYYENLWRDKNNDDSNSAPTKGTGIP